MGVFNRYLKNPPNGWCSNGKMLYTDYINPNDKFVNSYINAGGCRQAKRSKDPCEAGYYDKYYYMNALKELFELLPECPKLLDLGCGDGRFIKMIIEENFEADIVALDFNPNDLNKLIEEIPIDYIKKVLPIYASVLDRPFLVEKMDGVIFTEVACALEDPKSGYISLSKWMRPGAYALVSNIAKESYFVHALLNYDLAQIDRVCRGHYHDFVRGDINHPVKLTLYDESLMDEHARQAGLEIIKRIVISSGPALLRHAQKMNRSYDKINPKLMSEIHKCNFSIPRLYVDILRKIG